MATEDLHAVVGGLQAHLGEKALQDGREEAELVVVLLVLGVVLLHDAVDHVVGVLRGEVDHRPPAFGHGLLVEQHAAHIRVFHQRVRHLVRVLLAGQRAHGAAFLGIR